MADDPQHKTTDASVQAAREKGVSAGRRGKAKHDNPYHYATTRSAEKARAWEQGREIGAREASDAR